MNNVNDIEATEDFIGDQLAWLLQHKSNSGLVWNQLATLVGVKSSTLSVFAGGNYQGDRAKIARNIYRYRQMLFPAQWDPKLGIHVT